MPCEMPAARATCRVVSPARPRSAMTLHAASTMRCRVSTPRRSRASTSWTTMRVYVDQALGRMLEPPPQALEGEAVMTRHRSFWLALVSTVAMLAASCTGTGEPSGASGSSGPPLDRDPNTLVVAVDAFNADFDPASAYLLSEALIWRGIYESLIRLKGDSASEVEPLLADSWEANADKSSWTFHLHPGVTFTDGTALDAAAVKAVYTRTIKIELGTQFII